MKNAASPIQALGGLFTRKRIRAWQDAAVSCGLQVSEVSPGWKPRIMASDGLGIVWIEPFAAGSPITRVAVSATGPPGLHAVTIRPQAEVHESPEVKVGDWALDHDFFIQGPVPLVIALLEEGTRRLLSLLNAEGRIQLFSGELLANVQDTKVPRVLPMLLDLRRRLAAPLDIPRRLAENAGQDPDPEVRLQNLRLLIYEHSGEPGTVAALRKALADPSPVIRLRAARALGAVEGRDVLLKIAEGLERDAMSAEAVEALGGELPFERAKALLDRTWPTGHPQTALECVRVIGYSGAPGAVDALAEMLALENIELAVAAAKALGSIESPAAEPPLIQALSREPSAIRMAAANALARVGSTAAVLPLKEAAESALLDPDFRQAARQAIAEIQSRVQGASPGQLSLAGAEAGQLSLAADSAGQLSLSDEEG
jgi:HEAT repeat protein